LINLSGIQKLSLFFSYAIGLQTINFRNLKAFDSEYRLIRNENQQSTAWAYEV